MPRHAVLATLGLLLAATSETGIAGEHERARIEIVALAGEASPGATTMAVVTVSTVGSQEWPANGPVRLFYQWLDASGNLLERDATGRRCRRRSPLAPRCASAPSW